MNIFIKNVHLSPVFFCIKPIPKIIPLHYFLFKRNICKTLALASKLNHVRAKVTSKTYFGLKKYMKLFGKVLKPNPICFWSEKPQRISFPFITKKYDSNDFDNIGVKLGFWPHYNC